MWDGFFHLSTHIFTAIGMTLLWREAFQPHVPWSGKMLAGTILMGFGIFNLVEGIIDHQLFGIHHVNETVPQSQWIYWDIGFLVWGALMLAGRKVKSKKQAIAIGLSKPRKSGAKVLKKKSSKSTKKNS
jgi:uncharacterized membrane protein